MSLTEPFDFEAPLPLPATAPRLVSRVQDVSPRIGVALSVACGRTVNVTCTGAERVSSGHLAAPGQTWARVECGLIGTTILVLPARLTVVLADVLMGGRGESPAVERPATHLEQKLVLRHLAPALQPIALAFAGNGMTGLVIGEPESMALPPSVGDLVALRLQTELDGTDLVDILTLALPARALLPGSEIALRLAEPPAATGAALLEVPVDIAVRLQPVTLSAAEVETLAPGDLIRLEHPENRPLVGLLGDRPAMSVSLGRRGRRRAVLIHDLLGEL